MNDEAPIPALPLEYFQASHDPWPPMIRAVAWLTLLTAGYHLLGYSIELGCYFWEQSQPAFMRRSINGTPFAAGIPMAFAALIVFIGAVDMLKLIDSGRRWVVGGSLMMLIVLPPTEIWTGLYYHVVNYHSRYGIPYAVMYFLKYVLSAAGGTIYPFFVWKFFRRSEVRAVFSQRRA